MIVRNLESLKDTKRIVVDPNGQWVSRRLLLAEDGMGFTFNITEIRENCHAVMEYKNHLEACYCISGEGEIIDEEGNRFPLKPGTIYALNKYDRHTLLAHTAMVLASIFNPPLKGSEVHLADGSYPLDHENP